MFVFEHMVKICGKGLFLADFHKNVGKELPNWYHIFLFLYKILLNKGGFFIHMNYHVYFLKICQNIKFNEYENHCSQNIQR